MELTIDQALQKAVKAHKIGQLQVADHLYTAILKAQPKHSDANHNMGVLAVSIGKVKEALPFFKTALKTNPRKSQFWLSYIDALIKLERLADAKTVFDQAESKGVQGGAFNRLKQRLKELKPSETKVYQNQNPPADQLRPLINLYGQGQLQKVLDLASQLLQRYPKSFTLYNICGTSYVGLGQLGAAIGAYDMALTIKPDYAEVYNNKGNALQEQGKLEEAVEIYNKALFIKPHYAEAYNNKGNALQEQGELEAAIEAYSKALEYKPDYVEAHYNMGDSLKEQSKLEGAIEAYNKAIAIKPDYAQAYNNKGNALQEQGKLEAAIQAYDKAITIKPDYALAYTNMCVALKGIIFTKPSAHWQGVITSILDHKTYVRPKYISPAAISLLKFEPTIKNLSSEHAHGNLGQAFKKTVLALSDMPLLLRLMSVCPLADLELEVVFTTIRSRLLAFVLETTGNSDLIRFQSAMALQCFANEYVYDQSIADTSAVKRLEDIVKKTLSDGKQPSPQSILCLASFNALNEYEWCDLLHVTSDIEDVFTRQVIEPKQEVFLKSDIPALDKITDKVSSKVRKQYEESPYPRWINLGLRLKPASISVIARETKLKLFNPAINKVEAPIILIAGCGTGQHSIGTAARFRHSKVLAVDLSLSSLAYAKRKTEELAVENIKYMQADILDLGKLNRQFDIIESSGVLHHMNDPVMGWRVLTSCLKQGGLMKVGLYSKSARQHIIKIREEIAQSGIGPNYVDMKSFRSSIIKSDQPHHKRILNSGDFYSLSTLRDLLFHVQEHRFTILQIQDCLTELGLKFCGFEPISLVKDFSRTNSSSDDIYDLEKWNAYEADNPSAFAGMYEFWCQKVA